MPTSLPPSTQAYAEFVKTVVRNEAKYKEIARVDESKITKYCAWEVVDLLYHVEFPLHEFKLDRISALSLDSDVADVIGLRYRRLPMRAKTKFHMDQIKVKLECLRLLVFQAYQHIHKTKVEIKYIEGLKVKQVNKLVFLKPCVPKSKISSTSFVANKLA